MAVRARVTQIATYTFSGLEPGQSATWTWSVCRQGTISAGADAGQAVAESNERNNSASVTNVC
jgi:subtilase family serine protease